MRTTKEKTVQVTDRIFCDSIMQHLQVRRKLWAKDDANNPLYGSLKYHD